MFDLDYWTIIKWKRDCELLTKAKFPCTPEINITVTAYY